MLTRRTIQRGFTLVELMIAIVIVAIVMAVGAPSYRAWIQNTKIRNTAESILSGLQVARSEAVRRNAQVQFTLTGTNSNWTVDCVAVTANCPAAIQSRTSDEGSSAAITVTPDPAGVTTVIFSNFGTTTTPAVSYDVDVDPAILPAAESRNLRITVGTGGTARMCDPEPTLSVDDPRKCI